MLQESRAGRRAQGPRLQNETDLHSDLGSTTRKLTRSLPAPEAALGELTEENKEVLDQAG